jgi:hypothetical protein
VEHPALFAGDTAVRPRPATDRFGARSDDPAALIVSFLVDTLGQPDERSLKVLHSPSVGAAESVRVAMRSWHFTPAVLGGCHVPQLVQTKVDP